MLPTASTSPTCSPTSVANRCLYQPHLSNTQFFPRIFPGLLGSEDEGTKIFTNAGNYSPKDTPSFHRNLESSEIKSIIKEIHTSVNSPHLMHTQKHISEPFCRKYLTFRYRKPIHRAICTWRVLGIPALPPLPGRRTASFFKDISLHFKRKVSLQQDGALPRFWWAGNFTSQPQKKNCWIGRYGVADRSP